MAGEWFTQTKNNAMSNNIIQLYPIIEGVHKKFPNDIVHINFSLVGQLFDEKTKKLNLSLLDSSNSYWTPSNPFPINSVYNNEEILSIWDRKIQGSSHYIFTQTKEDIKYLIDVRDKDPSSFILILGTHMVKAEKDKNEKLMEVCTMYTINIRPEGFFLGTSVNVLSEIKRIIENKDATDK